MARKDLRGMFEARTGTPPPPVKPVNLFTSPQADTATSPQSNQSTSGHVDISAQQVDQQQKGGHEDLSASLQSNKSTKQNLTRYTTYLRPATQKAIKLFAAENDIKDYSVVQEAMDEFFKKRGVEQRPN